MQSRTSSSNFRHAAFKISVVLALLSLASRAFAQGAPNEYQIGLPPYADFSGSDFENVQLNNGNLHIEVPLWNATGRGLPVGFKYVYDSLGWGFNEHCGSRTGTCTDNVAPHSSHLALQLVGPQSYSFGGTIRNFVCPQNQSVLTYSYSMSAPDGTKHHFVPDPIQSGNEAGCLPHPSTVYADDGSGWILQLDPSTGTALRAVGKDGSIITSGAIIEDANGNEITTTDTLGRQFSGNSFYDSSGILRTVSVASQTFTIQTNLCQFSTADFCNERSGLWSAPQVITLPNGMAYTFSYDQNGGPTHPYYGQPLSVTLPTGGQITWGWNGEGDSGPALATRQLSGDQQPWRYGSGGATVTDPAGNDTIFGWAYYYTPYWTCSNGGSQGSPIPYVTTKNYYQGSHTSGTLIKTIQTDYQTSGNLPILPIRETTTWNQQNLVTSAETDYDSFHWLTGNCALMSASNPIEKREYDYGTGIRGALIRTTDYGYLHLSNSTYLGLNILDKVTSKKIYAGGSGGTLTAQALNTYDGVAIPANGNTSANPAPNHDYTNFPASYNFRGNLTQASKGLKSGTTWTWLNTNNTYNDLGEILTSTDPLGHQTSYDYTDNWASISNPQCVTSAHSYGFPTTVTDPLSHQTKHTYYSCTSLTGSTRDGNDIAASRAGTTFSYDLMSRLVATNFPDGGQTVLTYNDAVPYTKTSRIDLYFSDDVGQG